ncbi:hypothetical protein JOQ06_018275, partial [Pogonophryne albipinna]
VRAPAAVDDGQAVGLAAGQPDVIIPVCQASVCLSATCLGCLLLLEGVWRQKAKGGKETQEEITTVQSTYYGAVAVGGYGAASSQCDDKLQRNPFTQLEAQGPRSSRRTPGPSTQTTPMYKIV